MIGSARSSSSSRSRISPRRGSGRTRWARSAESGGTWRCRMGADLAIELEEHVNGNGRHGGLVDAPMPDAASDDAAGDAVATEVAGLAAVIESMLLASGA